MGPIQKLPANIVDLPNHLLVKILKELPIKDALALLSTNKALDSRKASIFYELLKLKEGLSFYKDSEDSKLLPLFQMIFESKKTPSIRKVWDNFVIPEHLLNNITFSIGDEFFAARLLDFASISEIKALYLRSLKNVNPTLLDNIAKKCPFLERLDLGNDTTEKNIVSFIKNCQNLKSFRLVGNKNLTPDTLKEIAKIRQLEELTLRDCSLKESVLIQTITNASAKTLKYLEVSHNKELQGPLITTECPYLETFNAHSCLLLTAENIIDTLKYCPNLKTLMLSGNADITSQTVTKILELCPKLEQLDLDKCSNIKESLMNKVSTHLCVLKLNGCPMTHEALVETTKNTPKLEQLDISENPFVRSETVKEILWNSHYLERLDLLCLNKIEKIVVSESDSKIKEIHTSGDELKSISIKSDTINHIYIMGSKKLTSIELNCKNLKEIYLQEFPINTQDIVIEQLKKCEEITRLVLGKFQKLNIDDINIILDKNKSMSFLHLSSSEHISKETLRTLKNNGKCSIYLDYKEII